MRRIVLLIAGLGAGCCVFFALTRSNADTLYAYGLAVPAFLEQTPDVPETVPDGPQYVQSLASADITLPRPVEGTPLIAEQLTAYDGPFLEDGSDQEVTNVAALILRNVGTKGVEQAVVVLERGDLHMTFEVTAIPPGGAVMVLEKERQRCAQRNFTACYGWARQSKSSWSGGGRLQIETIGMGTIAVTNTTEKTLKHIRLYYKTYLETEALYIGGTTYQIEAGTLAPGQTKQLQPGHYAWGYSQIVRVQIE